MCEGLGASSYGGVAVSKKNTLPTLQFHKVPHQLTADLERALRGAVMETALAVEATAKVEIQTGAKSGRVYKRGSKSHIASAPGQAPATDTGNLVNSIATAEGTTGISAVVAVNAEYAEVLEFGGIHMKARPFLAPAVRSERQSFKKRCEKALEKALQ